MRDGPLFIRRLPWYTRLPIKWMLVALCLLIVSFPNPKLMFRHYSHARNPNALIEPDSPAIQPLVEELRPLLSADLPPREALKRVEKLVYERVPYAWDWDLWWNCDYLPTVSEVMEKGKEDCDGQALVAASVLRRLGYQAELVSDFAHVWVKTDQGELMSPGKSKAIVATEHGWSLEQGAVAQMLRVVPFGIAVFPLWRELAVLVAVWLLLLRRGGSAASNMAGLLLMLNGLLFIRVGAAHSWGRVGWAVWVGVINFVVGFTIVLAWPKIVGRKTT